MSACGFLVLGIAIGFAIGTAIEFLIFRPTDRRAQIRQMAEHAPDDIARVP